PLRAGGGGAGGCRSRRDRGGLAGAQTRRRTDVPAGRALGHARGPGLRRGDHGGAAGALEYAARGNGTGRCGGVRSAAGGGLSAGGGRAGRGAGLRGEHDGGGSAVMPRASKHSLTVVARMALLTLRDFVSATVRERST